MTIISLLRKFAAATLLFAALTGQAFAIGDCGPDASDSDGDGWGWENNQSCRMVSVQAPAGSYCQLANSDSDGDGWGWENGASCQVNPGSNNGDGANYGAAKPAQLNTLISSQLNGIARHYYKFEVTETTSVELDTDFLSTGSIDASITDGQDPVLEPRHGQQDACLVAGTYYLLVDRNFIDTTNTVDYSVTITTTQLNCVEPITTVSDPTEDDFFMTADGSIYKHGWSDDYTTYSLSRISDSGTPLWTTETDYFDHLESTPDGSLLVISFNTLSLMNSEGQFLWSVDHNTYTSALAVGRQAVIYESEDSLIAYNLTDGSPRWRFDLQSYDYVKDITLNENGQVVVWLSQDVLLFNQ